jgi:hypothetical protein
MVFAVQTGKIGVVNISVNIDIYSYIYMWHVAYILHMYCLRRINVVVMSCTCTIDDCKVVKFILTMSCILVAIPAGHVVVGLLQ